MAIHLIQKRSLSLQSALMTLIDDHKQPIEMICKNKLHVELKLLYAFKRKQSLSNKPNIIISTTTAIICILKLRLLKASYHQLWQHCCCYRRCPEFWYKCSEYPVWIYHIWNINDTKKCCDFALPFPLDFHLPACICMFGCCCCSLALFFWFLCAK